MYFTLFKFTIITKLSNSTIKYISSLNSDNLDPEQFNNQANSPEETYFGFKKVAVAAKQKLVGQVFSSVASKYDIMNDVMSCRLHHKWKARMIEYIIKPDIKMLDIAGGTGDIAIKFLQNCNDNSTVKVVDINAEMLHIGQARALDSNILHHISFEQGDAENLSFEDDSFDYYTVAFGIRNMTNISKVLSEAYRVLKPGGVFLCLELFPMANNSILENILKYVYDFYSFNIVPKIGKIIADDENSYQYLIESIRKFPTQEKFAQMITESGFVKTKYENLTFGVCAIHSAYKL